MKRHYGNTTNMSVMRNRQMFTSTTFWYLFPYKIENEKVDLDFSFLGMRMH